MMLINTPNEVVYKTYITDRHQCKVFAAIGSVCQINNQLIIPRGWYNYYGSVTPLLCAGSQIDVILYKSKKYAENQNYGDCNIAQFITKEPVMTETEQRRCFVISTMGDYDYLKDFFGE